MILTRCGSEGTVFIRVIESRMPLRALRQKSCFHFRTERYIETYGIPQILMAQGTERSYQVPMVNPVGKSTALYEMEETSFPLRFPCESAEATIGAMRLSIKTQTCQRLWPCERKTLVDAQIFMRARLTIMS